VRSHDALRSAALARGRPACIGIIRRNRMVRRSILVSTQRDFLHLEQKSGNLSKKVYKFLQSP